jgi:phenylacetate-CoA ligase
MKHYVRYSLPEFNSMSTEEIRKEQERLLAIQLRYDYDKSPLYKKKFDDAGARPEDIKTLDDLRRLPIFMTKAEERDSQQESLEKFGHPFGMHLCAPVEDLYVVGTTSGTTGRATFSYLFTKEDVDVEAAAFGYNFTVIGAKRGDRVLWCYALGIYATTIHTYGIRHIGALPIDIDARAGVEMMLTFAEQTRTAYLAATPSLAMHLAEKAPLIIHKDVRELGFKALQLTGEPWAAIPEIKSKIEEQYGCRLLDLPWECPVTVTITTACTHMLRICVPAIRTLLTP